MATREDSNMYNGQYTWIIKGNKLTQMIKTDNGQEFTSPTFKMCSLDWCIEASPNGYNDDNIGSFDVFLKLLSSPQKGNKIIICTRIYCKELDSSNTYIESYTKDDSKGWPNYTLSLNEVRNNNMREISFIIEIRILRILNESSFGTQIIYENEIYFNEPFNKQLFNWIIDEKLIKKMKNSLNGKAVESPIYNKMWCLEIAPNGYKTTRKDYFDVFLIICAFPKNISKISVEWKINCKEMQINTNWTKDFDINGCRGWLWSAGKEKILSFTNFRNYNLNRIEFKVNINILSIYDNNGKKINENEWNKYIKQNKNKNNTNINENDEKKESENINNIILQSLVTRMDEINSQIKSLTNIITNIQQNEHKQKEKNAKMHQQINKLIEFQSKMSENKEHKEECEEYKIRKWIKNTVCLEEYSEILLENGFDSMESLIDISMNDLNEIGIHKIGHRKKIFKYAQKLAVQQQQPPNINLNVWKCEMCETQNANSIFVCTLCGLKKNYMNKGVEGSNIIDTAQ